MSKECATCRKRFYKRPSDSRVYWGKKRYCSVICAPTTFKKGMPNPFLGKKHTAQSKRKMRLKKLGKLNRFWVDGTSAAKEKAGVYRHRRRATLKGNGGSYTVGEWENVKAQYNWTCRLCLKSEPAIKLSVDHIIPISKGGSNNIENIQPLCLPCNLRKSNKIGVNPAY